MTSPPDCHKKHSGVVHVFNRLDPGGAELRTTELVRESNFRFVFHGIGGGLGALDDQLRQSGHTVVNLKVDLRTLYRYYVELRSGGYKAVHVHLGAASGLIVLLAFLARIPRRIVHFRSDGIGGGSHLTKTIYLHISRLLIGQFATHLLGVSPGALQHGWKRSWQEDPRCRVLPNGYDSHRMRKQIAADSVTLTGEGRPLRLVSVARPLPEKNRARAIQIWRKLSEVVDAELVLVGGLSAQDEALCSSLQMAVGGEPRIVQVGFTPRPLKYVEAADVLLVTSMREGLPGVVLEALALGIPVVASDLPGIRWIQEHVAGVSICGLQEEDSVWIRAIRSALEADSERIKASFDASPFQLSRVLPEFMEIWGLQK